MNELDPVIRSQVDANTGAIRNLCDTNDMIFRELGAINDRIQLGFRTTNSDRQYVMDYMYENARAQQKLFTLAWVGILVSVTALAVALFAK